MRIENNGLIMIDIQNDFCPGGALEVKEGNEIVRIVNSIQEKFSTRILTQDWHPQNHSSFASNQKGRDPFSSIDLSYGPQVLWPDHCIMGTLGANFHPDLITQPANIIIRKGFRPEIDSYSAFFENDKKTPTGLTGYLRDRNVKELFLTGLATDFCVFYSALDALAQGFSVTVISDACRAIDLNGSLDASMKTMVEAGVNFTNASFI